MSSLRERLLLALAARGSAVGNPHELQEEVDADSHSIVHILYALRAQGLVRFKLANAPPAWRGKPTHSGVSGRIPTRVRITDRGRAIASGLTDAPGRTMDGQSNPEPPRSES